MKIRVSIKEKKVYFDTGMDKQLCITIPDEKDIVIKLPEGVNVNIEELIKNIFEGKGNGRT